MSADWYDYPAYFDLAFRDETLPEADFIFLQAGPLELEGGAMDTLFAFKNLLQSHPDLVGRAKLAFCGE